MSTQLIPIFSGAINNESMLLCDARDLHEFLGVGKRFASWITERIYEYEFVENQDYMIASQNREAKTRGGHNRKDYHLTLDTAKELAMVERNDKGRQVRRYFIECEKRLLSHSQPVQPTAEPLSTRDMQNLHNLIWAMTNSMKFKQAWNQGVWYCLRAVTGRPSPQPFTVDDLPALAEQCQRIMKITAAVNAAAYDFEKAVIRKVVRKRGALEPLLAEMESQLLELQQQEQEGTLLLDGLHRHHIEGLVARH